MEEWYSQNQHTPLELPPPKLFWNTRGRAIEIRDQRIIETSLQRGFVPCAEGVSAGSYNPIFDKGTIEGIVKTVVTEKKDIEGELRLISV